MKDSRDILGVIKKSALEAVDNKKPVALCFGTVTNILPLTISVEQKLFLSGNMLVIASSLTKEENKLGVSDVVIMVREQGGQRYVVLDKVAG